jgi:hypothetical protein
MDDGFTFAPQSFHATFEKTSMAMICRDAIPATTIVADQTPRDSGLIHFYD